MREDEFAGAPIEECRYRSWRFRIEVGLNFQRAGHVRMKELQRTSEATGESGGVSFLQMF